MPYPVAHLLLFFFDFVLVFSPCLAIAALPKAKQRLPRSQSCTFSVMSNWL